MKNWSICALCAALPAFPAAAQSLFTMPPSLMIEGTNGRQPDAAASLYGVSMFAVRPPQPRTYQVHDLVSILVDETSKQEAEQKLKADKKYDISAEIQAMLDLKALLELQLKQGNINNLQLLDMSYDGKFDGKGKFERNDRFTMKIEAEVIDVKPNGVLVLEARKTIDKSGETQSIVLSGSCRGEDITKNNTVFSSQLANLTVSSKTWGQVDSAGKKGILSEVIDTIFAF